MAPAKLCTVQEISTHNTADDCWIVVEDQVWDVSRFAPEHPGGVELILRYGGKDATTAYSEVHSSAIIQTTLPSDCFRGILDRSSITAEWAKEVTESNPARTKSNDEKPPLNTMISSHDFERLAARTASPKAFAFYSTAATDCWTRDMNESMYKRIWFRPRVLRNVRHVNTSGKVLGNPVKLPLLISPTGFAQLIHPEAEKALARAAKSTGIIEIISTVASHPLPEILSQAPSHPFFLQLYVHQNRALTASTLASLSSFPNLRAVFVTVDAAGRGKRESDERLRIEHSPSASDPVINPATRLPVLTDSRGTGLTRSMAGFIDQGLEWADLKALRAQLPREIPIVLKGIQCAADAKLALDAGVEGIVLSNHGGRNLDYSPPAVLLLLEMHRLCPEVFGRVEVFVDGGVRRGGDLVKALCLGATAVGMGRPFLYSLAHGEEGARHLVSVLKDEVESVMKLIGIRDLSECHPGLLNTADVDHLVPRGMDHPYARKHSRARL